MDAKLKRRLRLLDDALDALLRMECQFFACDGPEAPIVDMKTCFRCAVLHRAIQMRLLVPAPKQYIREKTGIGDGCQCVVAEGVLEQYSAVDGKLL
jgi:hypothetical protein